MTVTSRQRIHPTSQNQKDSVSITTSHQLGPVIGGTHQSGTSSSTSADRSQSQSQSQSQDRDGAGDGVTNQHQRQLGESKGKAKESPKVPNDGKHDKKPRGWEYRWNLILAKTLRVLGPLGFIWHSYLIPPRANRPTETRKIPTRDGSMIKIYIYRPRPSTRSSQIPSPSPSPSPSTPSGPPTTGTTIPTKGPIGLANEKNKGRVCVINFHGGGWSIGHPTDDARFALFCTNANSGHTFISVDYRLAPEYPYPTPVFDCIDATRWIIAHADELGVDGEKVVLSGFSAGGCLAVTTALALAHPELEDQDQVTRYALKLKPIPSSPSSSSSVSPHSLSTPNPNWNSNSNSNSNSNPTGQAPILLQGNPRRIQVKGIIPFYPLVDFHTPRPVKLARTPIPSKMKPLPGWLTRMFDTAYLPTPIDRRHPFISPLFSSDSLLRELPNIHLCLCKADVLGMEGQELADRLRNLPSPSRDTSSTSNTNTNTNTRTEHPTDPTIPPSDHQQPPGSEAEVEAEADADAPSQPSHPSQPSQLEPEPEREREREREREVITRWVAGARHAWDKPPHLLRQNVIDEYEAAVDSISRWCR